MYTISRKKKMSLTLSFDDREFIELFKKSAVFQKVCKKTFDNFDATLDCDHVALLNEGSVFKLIRQLLEAKMVSFKEIVDKFCEIRNNAITEHVKTGSYDKKIINNKYVFDTFLISLYSPHQLNVGSLLNKQLISNHDIIYILDQVVDRSEALKILSNKPLIEYCFDNFLFATKSINIFSTHIQDNFFKHLREVFERNELFLKLIDIYEKLHTSPFTTQEKQELFSTCKSSDRARKILVQLLDNNLENTYDFEKLKEILIKDEKKKKIKMNF